MKPVHRLQIHSILHNYRAPLSIPPSYIRVCIVVWECGEEQTDTHTHRGPWPIYILPMRKLGVEELLVSAVMSMYTGAKTVVKTVYGNSGFEVKVGMHQGSGLSPLLFVIVMEAISTEFRVALPWELLYADDLVVIAETEEHLIKRPNEWKNNVENRGMRVNMNKTKWRTSEAVAEGCKMAVWCMWQRC